MKNKLNLTEGLHLFMLCSQSMKALELVEENYKKDNDRKACAIKIVDTFNMFKALMADRDAEDKPENLVARLFSNSFYKDMDNVLLSMIANPNVIQILSNTPYISDESYNTNLFLTVNRKVIKHISQLCNDVRSNLYLDISYDELRFGNYDNNNKLEKLKFSDSYPDTYQKIDKNFEILPDLFKAKLNSLNKNNILETLRMLVGGDTVQQVSEIFNTHVDIKLVLIDLIEKMAGAIADHNLYRKIIKVRGAKVILDSTNDLLTNIQKESAGILLSVQNQVVDLLAIEDETICEFDNAVMDSGEMYSVTLKAKRNEGLTKDDIEEKESYNCYQYGLVINNYNSTANESGYVVCKENVDSIPEEELLIILGYITISLFKITNDTNNYGATEAFIANALKESRTAIKKAEKKIINEYPTPEDVNRLEEILTVNFKNRFNLDNKLDRITLYRNTISDEDITVLARLINMFIESLNR